MRFIKKSIHICLLSFRQWIGDYRIFIVFFAAFTYCYMVLNPVKDFLASTGVRINACVPLFLFEYSYSKFFLLLFCILLFCDAPFFSKTQQMQLLRSGRICWCTGKIFYIAGTSIVYLLSVYVFSWLILFPYVEFSNQWGKAIMTLAKTDAPGPFHITGIFFQGKIVDYFTPGQAMFFSMLLCLASILIIGLIIFFGNFMNQSIKLGILAALALAILDMMIFNSAVLSDSLSTYFSPMTWSSLMIINIGGLGRTPDIFYVGVMDCVLIIGLLTGTILCSMRKQIE